MSFDPQSFINIEVTGQMETKFPLIPVGEYRAYIKSIEGRQITPKDPSRPVSNAVEALFVIDDEKVRELTGLPEPSRSMTIFIDLNSSGMLELGPGKNIQLGRLREALRQNDSSKPWNFRMLVGQPCKVKIGHSPNPKSPGDFYANIDAVSSL